MTSAARPAVAASAKLRRERSVQALELEVRELAPTDVDQVLAIQAACDRTPPARTRADLERFLAGGGLALAAYDDGVLAGYLLGEVRRVEFGLAPSGWVLGIGVDPECRRHRLASALLQVAATRFRGAGIHQLRTLVQRTDVPLLSLFRANGWIGGNEVQLQLELPLATPSAVASPTPVATQPEVSP